MPPCGPRTRSSHGGTRGGRFKGERSVFASGSAGYFATRTPKVSAGLSRGRITGRGTTCGTTGTGLPRSGNGFDEQASVTVKERTLAAVTVKERGSHVIGETTVADPIASDRRPAVHKGIETSALASPTTSFFQIFGERKSPVGVEISSAGDSSSWL